MKPKLTHLQKSQLAAAKRNHDDADMILAVTVKGHVENGAPLELVLQAVGWSRSTYYRHLPKQLQIPKR